jgi:hypothetical protein
VGSLAYAKGQPPDPPNEDAASGTCTHWLGQQTLSLKQPPENWLGKTLEFDGFKFGVDQDRCDRVWVYVNAIRREPGTRFVEVRLDTSEVLGAPDQGGTPDVILLDTDAETISVHDLKDGAEIIYAGKNEQLATYGAAALHKFDMLCDWKKIRVCIHQPRMKHYDERTYTRAELEAFMVSIRMGAIKAYDLWLAGSSEQIQAALTPGEKQCKWCPMRGKCEVRAESILELFPVVGGEVDEPEVAILDDASLASAHSRLGEIENWCRDIRSEAFKRAIAGRTLPGKKLVRGRAGKRYWKDAAKVEGVLSMLIDDIYEPREIISPTQVEKRSKAAYASLTDYVGQNEGGLSLVDESEPGEAITVTKAQFEVIHEATSNDQNSLV